jgi:ribonuclease D
MTERYTPDKEEINALPVFDRLALSQITLVKTQAAAHAALLALQDNTALGFDTESKPTFAKNESSDGPHIVQLSTARHGWVFQLQDPDCRRVVATLLESPAIVKAGFGLGDDKKRIRAKLGIDFQAVLDLNATFRALGYRKDMGVRGAVAVLFNQRFIKSKKASTSNWANPDLTEAQLVYAANDAYAAMRVWAELQATGQLASP